MSSIIQKYGVGIFSFLISVLTAIQVMNHFGLVDILQLAVIVVTSFTAYILKLLPRGWQGGLKTGADIVGVILLLVIPYAVAGVITRPQIVLVIIGVIKALATEFGVQIRTDSAGTGTPGLVTDSPAIVASTVLPMSASDREAAPDDDTDPEPESPDDDIPDDDADTAGVLEDATQS